MDITSILGKGTTPNYAVLAAMDFLLKYPQLEKACAVPHTDCPLSHITHYGEAGIRVFPSTSKPGEQSLLEAVRDYAKKSRRNPSYEIGARFIKAPEVLWDGKQTPPDHFLRSLIAVERNSARIYIVKQNNECWRRFVGAKEFCHVVMESDYGTRITDPRKQLDLALKIGVGSIDWNLKVEREQFAWIMAIELTLPYWHRDCLHRQIDAGVDYGVIAQHFRVPRLILDGYTNGNYREKSMEVIKSNRKHVAAA